MTREDILTSLLPYAAQIASQAADCPLTDAFRTGHLDDVLKHGETLKDDADDAVDLTFLEESGCAQMATYSLMGLADAAVERHTSGRLGEEGDRGDGGDTMTDCRHCWHERGPRTLLGRNEIRGYVCCHCGEMCVMEHRVESVDGHGPHVPKVLR